MYRLICQKPAHFLSAQMALVSTFFKMFIVLGMYNLGYNWKVMRLQLVPMCCKQYTMQWNQNQFEAVHIDFWNPEFQVSQVCQLCILMKTNNTRSDW